MYDKLMIHHNEPMIQCDDFEGKLKQIIKKIYKLEIKLQCFKLFERGEAVNETQQCNIRVKIHLLLKNTIVGLFFTE